MNHENNGEPNAENSGAPALAKPDSLANINSGGALDRIDPQEVELLAFEMAKAYKSFVTHYRKNYKMDAAEADAKVQEMLTPGNDKYESHVRHGPPQEATWYELEHLVANDPQASADRWRHIKKSAVDELESGWRAAFAADGMYGTPWERAQFIALRQSLMKEWKPVNGIETALLETMAQAQTFYLKWMSTIARYMSLDLEQGKSKYDKDGRWELPHVSNYEAIEQAGAMADRFNRLFLRTLRQLRDLRRYTPPVTIQSAAQVNIGGQQVNVTEAL